MAANDGMASGALMVRETAVAFDAIPIALSASPESVAITVTLNAPAAEGVPEIMQFGLAFAIVSPAGKPVAVQFVSGRMPPVVGIVAEYTPPVSAVPPVASPVANTNCGTASAATTFTAVAALVVEAAVESASPVSVAEILMDSGLAAWSAAVGVPDRTQFGLAVVTINPVIAGRPETVQLPAANGKTPPAVGIVSL